MNQIKIKLPVVFLVLSVVTLSCLKTGNTTDTYRQQKAVFQIPYDSDFSAQFSLDGNNSEFERYDSYEIESDTPTGKEAENWAPGSKDLSFKTTFVIDDHYLYFFGDILDDDLRNPEDVYEAWMGDAIEYYIGMYDISTIENFENKLFTRSHGDWRLSFMPTGYFALDGWLIQDVPGVESVIFPKFSEDGYIVEARVALNSLVTGGHDFKVYDGLKIPIKIDAKDQDRSLTDDTEATLLLGSGGIPSDSRYNDDWKYPDKWAIGEIVGAPEMGPEFKNRIPFVSSEDSFNQSPIDLFPRAFTSLEDAIESAVALVKSSEAGIGEGQFPEEAIEALQEAISEALNAKNDNPGNVNAVSKLYDACSIFESTVNGVATNLIDSKASKQTRYLHANLKNGMGNSFLYGMHHSTGYGVGWKDDDDRSDVKDVCGDYPAIHGEDLSDVLQDVRLLERIQYRIKKTYKRGGVITMSWHQNDYDNRSCYSDQVNYEKIVANILPGGLRHEDYVAKLDLVADFFKSLRGKNGEAIPIIFRPYHEHFGSWFWWGIGHCTTEEYNQLWQFTVKYLRDTKNVNNLLWAISPDLKFLDDKEDYFDRFPGDEYVDIYGVDYYHHVPLNKYVVNDFKKRLNNLVSIALEHNKIPALTEIGQDGLDDPNWHSRIMLNPLKYDSLNRHIAFGVTWRNAGTWHFHSPYPGHYSVPDFLEFYRDPFVLFEGDLPDMYGAPTEIKKFSIPAVRPPSDFSSTNGIAWSNPDYSINHWSNSAVSQNYGEITYFSKDLFINDIPEKARFMIQYVGGFVLYLNGKEIFRYNLPGEVKLDADTKPFTNNRNSKAITLSDSQKKLLRKGNNRVVIEVHGGSEGSSFFDALFETPSEQLISYGSQWACFSE